MKLGGYYWCDHCNEAAFGQRCQTCHRDARFQPERNSPRKKPAPVKITMERARELFSQLHAAVKN